MAYLREGHNKVRPKWRSGSHKPTGKMIGIEFEIENKRGYQAILDAIPDTDKENLRPVTERDGSLDERYGVEIVFPPFSHGSLRLKGSFFGRTITALEEAGCESHRNCGMHMNINTEGWTVEQKRAFMCWLHWVPAAALQRIGGRAINNWCPQDPYLAWTDALGHTQHQTCAGIRPNRIEVRFPQATLDHTKIKNLTNFFSHLQDWCALPETITFMRRLDADGARPRAVLVEFCNYLTTKYARSRSAPIIHGILLNA